QHGEHSRVVVGAPTAATIAAGAKGRGVVRVQGGELVEFQAARIGNPASASLTADRAGLHVADVALADLALPRPLAEPPEVPNEYQDLHRVVTLVRAAAGL